MPFIEEHLKNLIEYHQGKYDAYLEILSLLKDMEKINLNETTLEIREIGLSERKKVENLIRRNQSDILELEEVIVNKLSEGLNFGLFIQDKLIGYVLSTFDIENELYQNETVLSKINELNQVTNDGDLLLISDLLIDKNYRRNGLGLMLLKELILKSKSSFIFIVGRNESNGKRWQAERLVKSIGFKFFYAEKGFWNEVSIEEDYECHACKIGCRCEMVLRYLNCSSEVPLEFEKILITSEGKS